MSRILIADIKAGVERLEKILSSRHELFIADRLTDVLKFAKDKPAKFFDLLIVGVHFDDSKMFDVISAAKKSSLAETPAVGFAEMQTKMVASSRNAIEGIMHVLGAADYVDTANRTDEEIMERLEAAIAEGKGIGTAGKASLNPTNKRTEQSSLRWTKILEESMKRRSFQVLLVSTDTRLREEIARSVKNFSGIDIDVVEKPVLADALVEMTNAVGGLGGEERKFQALICDLENLPTSDARDAMCMLAEQLPVIALTSPGSAEMSGDEQDTAITSVAKADTSTINMALAVIGTLPGVTAESDAHSMRFSHRLVQLLRSGLQSVDAHKTLTDVLNHFCAEIENFGREQGSDDIFVTILLRDRNGKSLRSGAAPSIAAAYSEAIDGVPIGPSSGSCGTAAFLSKPVYVTNIDTDPKWADYRKWTRPHKLKACWSMPIIDNQANVLGTFAIYYTAPREPADAELRLIGAAAEVLKTILIYARSKEYSLTVS